MTVVVLWFVLAVSTGICIYSWVVLPSLASKRLNESMAAFSKAIELRFPSRQGLSSEAVALCRLVGKQMKLGRSSLLDLEMACWLRDVGLCSTPYQLLNCKPRSGWTMDQTAPSRYSPIMRAMGVWPPVLFINKCDNSADPWWARVESPAGTTYRCVVRRKPMDPAAELPPGMVRWRWKLKDEGMWVRCPGGCCEKT